MNARSSASFSRTIWVSCHQNISILDFIGAQDEGGHGDNWSYKTHKAAVKSSPNVLMGRDAHGMGCRQTNSVRALKGEKVITNSFYGHF